MRSSTPTDQFLDRKYLALKARAGRLSNSSLAGRLLPPVMHYRAQSGRYSC